MDFLAQFRWRPGIGDPSIIGWVTVAAYAAAATLAYVTARNARHDNPRAQAERWLWLAVAALMAFLCLNKQLDLQTLLTDIGRVIAQQQGWYEERRTFQKWFVVGVLATSGTGACWFVWRCRAFWKSHKVLILGLQLLLTFIVVRAISLHKFDVFNQSRLLGVRVNSILELTGIILVATAAVLARYQPKPIGSTRRHDR